MTEPSLAFISKQLERMQLEQRRQFADIRDEISLLREQVRIQGSAIARLNDTITMDILDRLQALEAKQ